MNRFRLQLIAILVLVALLPAIPAGWAAHRLFRQVLDPIMTDDVLDGARAGLASTRDLLEVEKRLLRDDVLRGVPLDTLDAGRQHALDPRERATLAALASRAPAPDPGADRTTLLIPPDRVIIGGVDVLAARIAGPGGEPVWVTRSIPAELAERAARLTETVRFVQSIRHERGTVTRGFAATFLVVYGVILVLVLLFGLFLASRVTRPVRALGAGIEDVASGNLDVRVPRVAGGPIGRLLESFNDMVTRLRTQQADLLRLEKLGAWRQMARSLAHEIKNPLTPIQLAAQEMRDSYGGENDDHRALLDEGTSIIEEEVRALRNLVTEFSQFARLPEPSLQDMELGTALRDLESLYGPEQLRVEDGAHDIHVHGDREQIHRVLINLINNGLQAQSAAGGTGPIEVSAETVDGDTVSTDAERPRDAGAGFVRLRVADRGPGVPESDRRRIFEPDFTTKSDGMGLGLAIVEATIRGHGGTIHVEDREDGGAVFVIHLPDTRRSTS